MAWSTAGSVALLDSSVVGKRSTTDVPMVQGHSTSITDLSFRYFFFFFFFEKGAIHPDSHWDEEGVCGVIINYLPCSPFDDSLLATAAEDSVVKLWKIPDNMKDNMTAAAVTLTGHKKRVESLQFHPTANNVMATGSRFGVHCW